MPSYSALLRLKDQLTEEGAILVLLEAPLKSAERSNFGTIAARGGVSKVLRDYNNDDAPCAYWAASVGSNTHQLER